MDEDDRVVTAAGMAATLAAGFAAKKLLGAAWAKKRGVVPGDADAEVSWREAATFAIVSGAVVGTARLVAQRGVVLVLSKKTGKEKAEAEAPAA